MSKDLPKKETTLEVKDEMLTKQSDELKTVKAEKPLIEGGDPSTAPKETLKTDNSDIKETLKSIDNELLKNVDNKLSSTSSVALGIIDQFFETLEPGSGASDERRVTKHLSLLSLLKNAGSYNDSSDFITVIGYLFKQSKAATKLMEGNGLFLGLAGSPKMGNDDKFKYVSFLTFLRQISVEKSRDQKVQLLNLTKERAFSLFTGNAKERYISWVSQYLGVRRED